MPKKHRDHVPAPKRREVVTAVATAAAAMMLHPVCDGAMMLDCLAGGLWGSQLQHRHSIKAKTFIIGNTARFTSERTQSSYKQALT